MRSIELILFSINSLFIYICFLAEINLSFTFFTETADSIKIISKYTGFGVKGLKSRREKACCGNLQDFLKFLNFYPEVFCGIH